MDEEEEEEGLRVSKMEKFLLLVFMVSGLSNIMSSATFRQTDNASDVQLLLDDERAEQTRNVTLASLHALDDVQAAILLNKVPGEQPTVLQTDSFSVILQRQEKRNLDGLVLKTENSDVVFRLPAGLSTAVDQHLSASFDEVIDTQIHHFQQNPFSWTESSSMVTSHVTSLSLGHGRDQSEIAVQRLPQDVEMIVTNGDNVNPVLLQPLANQQSNQTIYAFNLTNQDAAVIVKVQLNQSSELMKIPPLSVCLQLQLAINDTNSQCNATVTMPRNVPDSHFSLNSTNVSFDPYLWVIPSEDLPETGGYFLTMAGGDVIGLAEHILVYAFSTQCLFWDEAREEWLGDGCQVGPFTTTTQTHCRCDHLTSFAASFLVLPNAVDLTDFSLFATIPENPITLITVVVVFVLFALCAVWAHRRDRLEKEKARIIVLEDNNPDDTYRYHVTVFTGIRRGAGTTAVVTLTLEGIVGNSEPHILSANESHHKVLQRSGIDSFLLTTKESLGILRSIRLWHDNGGSYPEWYLSRILVHDLEKDRWWYVLCHTWIAVDLGDCKIDKTFPVANSEDLKDFHHLFFTRSVRDMQDNHLWYSVLSRPPRSSFTRLQRVACCFTLLLSSMLMNIMFYKVGEGEPDETYNFGVMSLSVKTIVIATEASLLAFPINLAIVQIFREVRPKEEDIEIVPASESGDQQNQLDQDVECKDSLPHGEIHSTVASTKTETFSGSPSIQSQSSQTPKVASRNSPLEETSRPQSATREDTKSSVSRESLPERDNFNSDKAYEEYIDKYAEFVYLRSTCKSNNIGSHKLLEAGNLQGLLHVPFERDTASQLAQKDFRPDLLPECDQALLCPNMIQLTGTSINSNVNRTSPGSESSILPHSSQSNQSSHSSSSIHIQISPNEESSVDLNPSDSIIYTSYQDFLSYRLNLLYEQLYNPPPNLFRSEEDRRKALRKFKLALNLHGWREERESGSESSDETSSEQKDEVQRLFGGKGRLPWWCVYIAWFLTITSSLFAAYLIILYGLTFGKQKSIDWLTSMIISLFQSVVVIQPVKVIAIAAFFAIVLKSYDYDEIGMGFFKQLKIISGVQQISTISTQSSTFNAKRRSTHFYRPPPGTAVEQAREKRHAERRMYSLIKAFIGQVVFIWLALQVSNAQRDPGSIYLTLAMSNSFTTKLHQVKNMPDVYTWIKEEFVPTLYEGEPSSVLRESFLVGSPRLRQLRVKPEYCSEPATYRGMRPGCHAVPGTESEQGAYNGSWTRPMPSVSASQDCSITPWIYQSQWEIKGSYFLTGPSRYDRGGFVVDLGPSRASAENWTTLLEDSQWVDQYTHAMILEWVVYNANVNLFCSSTVVFRAEGTISIVPAYEFAILRLYRYTNKYDKFVLTLEVVYLLVVFVIIGIEVVKWNDNRGEYWNFWNCLTIVIILLSISATMAYIWQYALTITTMQLYKANPGIHHSFADLVLLDFVLVTSLAAVVFCSILKCLKILHYNDSMFLLQSTIHKLSQTLVFYLSMLVITLMGFASFGHLSFGRHFVSFCDLSQSIQSVFVLVLRRYSDMLDVMGVFGMPAYVFFAIANFFLLAVVVNLFIAMLLNCYSTAKRKFVRYKDHDVVSALTEWFFSALSIKERPKPLHKHNSIVSLDEL